MGRKVPQSGKAKREKLQAKRAAKDAPEAAHAVPMTHKRNMQSSQRTSRPVDRARGIESRFLRLDKGTADVLRLAYSQQPLVRPIDPPLAILRPEDIDADLTLPRRPKWRFDQSRKEVEKNEEGQHAKWLRDLDAALAARNADAELATPTYVERNLDVWRQLWRVTEISQIVIVLLDVRFPLLHYPTSLRNYLRSLRPRKEVILVLSKCDLVPPELAERWRRWLQDREDADIDCATTVLCLDAYRPQAHGADAQGRQRFVPGTSEARRQTLIDAIKAAHGRLCTPPPTVASDPARLAKWTPRVRPDIDWDRLERGEEAQQTIEQPIEASVDSLDSSKADARKARRQERRDAIEGSSSRTRDSSVNGEAIEVDEERIPDEQRFLTIGFLGSPNAGKSSLINAIFGRKVVRASRTAGATKRLQTHFLTDDVRLSDCPGLVWPSVAGMQRQILAGVLPIQHVESTLSFVAERLPLEQIVRLNAGDTPDAPAPQADMTRAGQPLKARPWTTDDLLASVALREGYLTAKAGRPDLARAGVQIIRQLHSGAIRWTFRPPDGQTDDIVDGIFLGGTIEEQSEDSGVEEEQVEQSEEDESDESETSDEEIMPVRSAFSQLDVEDDAEDDSD